MSYQCDGCSSKRLLAVGGKTSDMFNANFQNADYEGYVPNDLGIGGGDYIDIEICLDCGKVQGIAKAEDPEFYTNAKEVAEEDEEW